MTSFRKSIFRSELHHNPFFGRITCTMQHRERNISGGHKEKASNCFLKVFLVYGCATLQAQPACTPTVQVPRTSCGLYLFSLAYVLRGLCFRNWRPSVLFPKLHVHSLALDHDVHEFLFMILY